MWHATFSTSQTIALRDTFLFCRSSSSNSSNNRTAGSSPANPQAWHQGYSTQSWSAALLRSPFKLQAYWIAAPQSPTAAAASAGQQSSVHLLQMPKDRHSSSNVFLPFLSIRWQQSRDRPAGVPSLWPCGMLSQALQDSLRLSVAWMCLLAAILHSLPCKLQVYFDASGDSSSQHCQSDCIY